MTQAHLVLIKELIKNDVIVLTTGCVAMACGKAGLLLPEAAKKYCGAGLAEVCETVGIPPVLHLGSCVDNSRILMAATAVVKEGGLGDDISDLPAAGCRPGMDERKGRCHRPLLCGLRRVHPFWRRASSRPPAARSLPTISSTSLKKNGAACGILPRTPMEMAQEDDRPYRQEARSPRHRQSPRARAHGYGRCARTWMQV